MAVHISDDLLAYIENRLDDAGIDRVELHLDECAICCAEAVELRKIQGELIEWGRLVGRYPANTHRDWAGVRARWRSPVAVHMRNVSRRLSWQVVFSLAATAMALLSGITFSTARASTPSVPYIQTPVAHMTVNDTATVAAAQASILSETPTLTITPAFTLTPAPIETN